MAVNFKVSHENSRRAVGSNKDYGVVTGKLEEERALKIKKTIKKLAIREGRSE
jgi:hypothetical protein